MIAKLDSCAVIGIEGHPVQVQVDVANGLPVLHIVGLPDTAVREARERVRSAIRNSGYEFPIKRITVNLAPADTRKEGPGFDLAIALGILVASGQVGADRFGGLAVIGELSLDGSIRPVNGILPMALGIRDRGYRGIVVPDANAEEAARVTGLLVYPFQDLRGVVGWAAGETPGEPYVGRNQGNLLGDGTAPAEDFADVKGLGGVKRALEVAAAGGHNVLMVGPPGSGKTMLARRLPGILPPLTEEEALEVTRIYSVAGRLPPTAALITRRPFRAPHHSISPPALVGGGTFPEPGEVSLAHHGVLFLDELPEFRRSLLDLLRQPLEDGAVTVSRVMGTVTYPARFMLLAAMNPCPCGYLGDPVQRCRCTPYQAWRYQAQLSGPLLDRIDIHVEVPRLGYEEVTEDGGGGERSRAIRARVEEARTVQRFRLRQDGLFCNAQMGPRHISRFCLLAPEARSLLKGAFTRLGLSTRAYDRILKVARTIADLDDSTRVRSEHVAEAIQYRSLDRPL